MPLKTALPNLGEAYISLSDRYCVLLLDLEDSKTGGLGEVTKGLNTPNPLTFSCQGVVLLSLVFAPVRCLRRRGRAD